MGWVWADDRRSWAWDRFGIEIIGVGWGGVEWDCVHGGALDRFPRGSSSKAPVGASDLPYGAGTYHLFLSSLGECTNDRFAEK